MQWKQRCSCLRHAAVWNCRVPKTTTSGCHTEHTVRYVRRGLTKSSIVNLLCGVRQSSVLGPVLFVLYTVDLNALIESHGLLPHFDADDTQLYGPGEVDTLSSQVMQCTSSVADWMKSNRLHLNAHKTEVMWCSTCRRQHQLPSSPMNVDGFSVVSVQSVRDLGIYIDADLVMRRREDGIEVLRQLRQIHHSVPTETLQTLVVALVLSQLDYNLRELPC